MTNSRGEPRGRQARGIICTEASSSLSSPLSIAILKGRYRAEKMNLPLTNKSAGFRPPTDIVFTAVTCVTCCVALSHYDDVIMGAIASLITSLTIVYSTVYSDADQRKHQSSTSLAFGWVIHRRPVNSSHKWPVTQKMFPFDDVIMHYLRGTDESAWSLLMAWRLIGTRTSVSLAGPGECPR